MEENDIKITHCTNVMQRPHPIANSTPKTQSRYNGAIFCPFAEVTAFAVPKATIEAMEVIRCRVSLIWSLWDSYVGTYTDSVHELRQRGILCVQLTIVYAIASDERNHAIDLARNVLVRLYLQSTPAATLGSKTVLEDGPNWSYHPTASSASCVLLDCKKVGR